MTQWPRLPRLRPIRDHVPVLLSVLIHVLVSFGVQSAADWLRSWHEKRNEKPLKPSQCSRCDRTGPFVENRRRYYFYQCACGQRWKISKHPNASRLELGREEKKRSRP
ncbi:MAG TPA: hypothetical protein VE010_01790 [Thermoanaerobaculia bacterium]|nr:hypothetical protein [Thermoanaerobaculia bacterium]